MCGICGYIGLQPSGDLLQQMAGVLVHRGPDEDAQFLHEKVGLAARRLSIIDIAGGHQPIFNEDRSIALVFNGEIYNYQQLFTQLEGGRHRFRSRCDAEVIVHLYEEEGISCLHHLRGMFAFALYDLKQSKLYLVRDRLGIKPLYYWQQGHQLLFASEIKAILEYEKVPREPNPHAIDSYLQFRYVPGPESLFSGIKKLPAGHWLSYRNGESELSRYWQPIFHEGPYKSDSHYEEQFSEIFSNSVRSHLVSDVPVGAFLSGGVDSGAIVATMSRMVSQPVRTFSVGFGWEGDELSAARDVANRLECEHFEVRCEAEDLRLLPKIVWHLDEPVGDAIILPMFLLSRLAGENVKVVLSGEGGDETLGGYLFHKMMMWAKSYARWTNSFLRQQVIAPLSARIPISVLNRGFAFPASLGQRGRIKLTDYLMMIGEQPPEAEYRFLISLFDQRDRLALYDGDLRLRIDAGASVNEHPPLSDVGPYLNTILGLQYADWLPDDILMKADKLSMANSVEARVPFLDHEFVEFLFQAPPHLKLGRLANKILLRRYLGKILPGKAAHQPKKAFYVPMERYLDTPVFKEFLAICLSEESVRRRGYFKWAAVSDLIKKARGTGDFVFTKQVVSLVILEMWHRIFIDREPGWIGR
jgi:asparagine synthase (glutamine-hydrolysing)